MQAYRAERPGEHRHYQTELDILRAHYRFLLEDEPADGDAGWERRMVTAYHDRLFKEYCLADLRRAREPGCPVGLRWRSEAEVVRGQGQFSCGALGCQEQAGLASWEVNFGYVEQGVKKNALVKLRLCVPCSARLPGSQRSPAPAASPLLP